MLFSQQLSEPIVRENKLLWIRMVFCAKIACMNSGRNDRYQKPVPFRSPPSGKRRDSGQSSCIADLLHKLARNLALPKLTFQVIRRSIATLAQKKGTVKDVQGVLRHSRTATTTDIYMQEIPDSVRATVNAINAELRSKRKFRRGSAKLSGNLLPNATKPAVAVSVSCWKDGGPGRDRTDDLFHAMEARSQLRHRPTTSDIVLSLSRRQSSNGLHAIGVDCCDGLYPAHFVS
jgi:hypothetical protein